MQIKNPCLVLGWSTKHTKTWTRWNRAYTRNWIRRTSRYMKNWTPTNKGQRRGWMRKSKVRTGVCVERRRAARLREYKLKLVQVRAASTRPTAGFFSEARWETRGLANQFSRREGRLGAGAAGWLQGETHSGHRTMGATSQRARGRPLGAARPAVSIRAAALGGPWEDAGGQPGRAELRRTTPRRAAVRRGAVLRRASSGCGCPAVARRSLSRASSRRATAAPPRPAAPRPPPFPALSRTCHCAASRCRALTGAAAEPQPTGGSRPPGVERAGADRTNCRLGAANCSGD